MSESDTNVNREGRLDGLEEQLSVNHCNLVTFLIIYFWHYCILMILLLN